MDEFLAKYIFSKTELRRSRKPDRPITAGEIEAVIKKIPGTQKPWTKQFHRRILPNI